jgi:hypothetical protein
MSKTKKRTVELSDEPEDFDDDVQFIHDAFREMKHSDKKFCQTFTPPVLLKILMCMYQAAPLGSTMSIVIQDFMQELVESTL